MFDEKNGEPQDIFDSVDEAPTTQQNQPASPSAQNPTISIQPRGANSTPAQSLGTLQGEQVSEKSGKSMVVIAIIVVVLIIIAVGVLATIWFLRRNNGSMTDTSLQQALTNQATTSQTTEPETITEPIRPLDTDSDGLPDNDEVVLGTSISAVDSDQDGLSDFEEVKTWKTDPLNPDSDGDGYVDGQEIQAGYDPNQAGGILLNINNAPKL